MQLHSLEETRKALGNRSRTQFYRDLEAGRIPRPRYIGSRPYWTSQEILDLIENLPRKPQDAA